MVTYFAKLKAQCTLCKKWLLPLFVLGMLFCIFLLRFGIIFEIELWRERIHFGCPTFDTNQMTGCMSTYYNTTVHEKGIGSAIADVKERYVYSPTLRHSCHQVAHAIGRAAAESGEGIGTLFAEGDPFCWSGYYHGVVEGTLRGTNIANITPTFINHFCSAIPKTPENYFHYFNCVHGTGHAFMYVSHNDLPEALTHCAMFLASDDRENCAAGAFMENIVASESDHDTDFVRANDPYFPCTIVPEIFTNMCYRTQATHIWNIAPDPQHAFALCAALPVALADACTEGLGREIAAEGENTIAHVHTACALAPTQESSTLCTIGAMKNFISYYHDDVEAKKLCATSAPLIQAGCNKGRESFITLFASTTSVE